MRVVVLVALALALVACEEKKPAKSELVPKVAAAAVDMPPQPESVARIEVPEVAVRGVDGAVVVSWSAPAGTGLNEEAPFKVRWNRSEGLLEAPPEMKSTGASVKEGFTIPVKVAPGAPRATLDGEIDLVVCDVATHRVCVPVRRKIALGFIVTKDAPANAPLVVKLPEARTGG